MQEAKREETPQSGVKGICSHPQKKSWQVELTINGKNFLVVHSNQRTPPLKRWSVLDLPLLRAAVESRCS